MVSAMLVLVVACGGDDDASVSPPIVWPQVTIDHVVVDSTGAAIVAGRFSGTIDLGDGPVAAVEGVDGFTAKVTPAGDVTWLRTYGSPSDDEMTGLALLPDDSVIVLGSVAGAIDLGGGPLDARSDSRTLFVARYAADGAYVWAKRWSSDVGMSSAQYPVVSEDGAIYLVGGFTGGTTIDQFAFTFPWDAVLVKLASDGRVLWAHTVREPAPTTEAFYTVAGIALRGDDVVITGWASQGDDLGTGPLPQGHYVLVRAADDGALGDLRSYTPTEVGDNVASIVSTTDGQVVLGGEHLTWLAPDLTVARAVDLSDLVATGGGSYRAAVAPNGDILLPMGTGFVRYSAAGVELAREDHREPASQFAKFDIGTAAAGPDNRFVLVGSLTDPIVLGGQQLAPPPGAIVASFLVRLD
jgi:hypothetical protein